MDGELRILLKVTAYFPPLCADLLTSSMWQRQCDKRRILLFLFLCSYLPHSLALSDLLPLVSSRQGSDKAETCIT